MLLPDTTITYVWKTRYVVTYLATRYKTTETIVRVPEEKVEPSTALCREKLCITAVSTTKTYANDYLDTTFVRVSTCSFGRRHRF
jgi:hypothetical protein